MADFCRQCNEEHWGKDVPKDNHGIKDNEILWLLCEGCGRTVRVLNDGTRMECNTCVFAGPGVCEREGNVVGEIGDGFVCEFWKEIKLSCQNCEKGRPNGVCIEDLARHKERCMGYRRDFEPKTCECGWWSCPGRGCGECPSCYGEHCSCGM